MPSAAASTAPAAIAFAGVDKRFPARGKSAEVLAVRDVTFSIAPGEVVSIIGPSGCGKSTLLNMGPGLAMPSAGVVRGAGETVTGPNAHVAFMLQKNLLMPWRTIAQLGREGTCGLTGDAVSGLSESRHAATRS